MVILLILMIQCPPSSTTIYPLCKVKIEIPFSLVSQESRKKRSLLDESFESMTTLFRSKRSATSGCDVSVLFCY